ncbi:MAG TPA: hypothetical protein PKG56_04220 [Chitinophagaceae bacterium]|nr:hypothetical protein [Chitinophagaceae bacterium]MCC6634563.1 hypothetical protein [Chitinophagaceae bacterium]HMZ46580.1 hypothetical protein [Chitinophagaceae bacterium]HNE94023.1 hypothetical protein [Chitinophagaceae bacterium]HNJ58877.1 hypothetical protein [Chitinophagaceae bacterium]
MFKFIKKDSLPFGIILGLLGPIVGMLGFYFYRFHRLTIIEFIQYLGIEQRLVTNMVSFSLLANAIIFTLYINNHIDKTAKGIFISTCFYAVFVLVLKLWFV